jgi:hypothetical protein
MFREVRATPRIVQKEHQLHQRDQVRKIYSPRINIQSDRKGLKQSITWEIRELQENTLINKPALPSSHAECEINLLMILPVMTSDSFFFCVDWIQEWMIPFRG